MKRYVVVMLMFYILFACNSTKEVSQKTTASLLSESKIKEAVNYINNDTAFVGRLKRYYPDLKECVNLNFEAKQKVSPVSIGYFRKNQLIKTSFFQKYKMQNDVEFKEIKKSYDSINFFKEYYVELDDKEISNNCKIALTFSQERNGLLPIKFYIVDKVVDPKISYIPRTGYYLIEYDNKDKILNRFYVIKSN